MRDETNIAHIPTYLNIYNDQYSKQNCDCDLKLI